MGSPPACPSRSPPPPRPVTADRTRSVAGAAAPRLRPGDRVAVVSPASTPDRAAVECGVTVLESWGLVPEVGAHAFDRHAFRAGTDADRHADLATALADPGVRAVFATRGGKGSYRIADRFTGSTSAQPPLLVGFSDVTVLQLRLLLDGVARPVHAPMVAGLADLGPDAAEQLHRVLTTAEPVRVASAPAEPTAVLTIAGGSGSGAVSGALLGGNLDSLATAAGWALPPLRGAILLLEAVNQRLGHIDRQLTMLRNAGHLDGIVGVAVGRFTDCGPGVDEPADWSLLDLLAEHLGRWGVPVLGGLPLGHGPDPASVPIGTAATLDVSAGLLTVAAAAE